MIREFDEEELERKERGRDAELTLGAGTLLALGCGLILLCVICFGLGYSAGHRHETATVFPHSATERTIQPSGVTAKPAAGAQTPAQPPPAVVSVRVPNDPGTAAPQTGEIVPPAASNTNPQVRSQLPPSQTAQVRPALAGQGAAVQPAQPAGTLHVQPALSQVQGWMVQIASVSHIEDAEVLANALKKRGYAVTVRRVVEDSLLHVQTGPFVNRSDANAMRQKLLGDGYNAIVQP